MEILLVALVLFIFVAASLYSRAVLLDRIEVKARKNKCYIVLSDTSHVATASSGSPLYREWCLRVKEARERGYISKVEEGFLFKKASFLITLRGKQEFMAKVEKTFAHS